MQALTRDEAAERSRLIQVHGYDVSLDLTQGDETFASISRIRFSCTEPGADASTFLELDAHEVESVVLNGRPIDAEAIGPDRVRLDGLQADNELVASARMAYSSQGRGMHRYVDPTDGEAYLWSDSVVNNAGYVFACFDQPDLKAPFTFRVRAPEGWTVLSTGTGSRSTDGTWTFTETPPLPTYLPIVVAGPYHSVYEQHGDIPLGLHVRRSLAPHLDADELFEVTRQSFDFYHRTFGIPYPYEKYDQVFCPEYDIGAMENPGCVKFTDRMIYRSRVTDDERATRAVIIAHEMAHMWFGDLVTMRWWDDLWLNESFAEYAGVLTTEEATRFSGRWAWFCATVKAWGYRQDELPSTHPIAADVPDTEAALLNLDGISYAKGAGSLKQLVAWVGADAFRAGLRAYLERHAHGSATLADLLDALEASSGRDLRAWSRDWLQTPGTNVLRAEATLAADGSTYETVAIVQSAPEEHPTLREHRLAIGLYHRSPDGSRLDLRDRVEVEVTGERTEVRALAGARVPDLLLLNDDDLTWAKIRLDPRSLATIRDGGLARLDDPLARALVWASAWDMARDAELPVADYLALVLEGIGAEREQSLVEDLLRRARQAIDVLGRAERRMDRLASFADRCRELMDAAAAGSDLQLAYARGFAESVLREPDAGRVAGWLEGRDVPEGLAVDVELRWLIVRRLAAIGAVGDAEIAAEEAADPTSNGAESAAGARAAMPTEAAKAAAWEAIVTPDATTVGVLRQVSESFWQAEQLDLCAAYVDRYLEALPEIWRTRPSEVAWGLTVFLFPRMLASQDIVERVSAAIDRPGDDAVRRLLSEGRADLERAIRTRALDR